MHVPDGFLDVPTSVATGAIALGAVGLTLRKAEPEIRRSGIALAGLTSAFVFAVQMVNFPVGPGTSGHLMGGALAAALVGPWTAVLCLTVVLVVQALLFADGGLTALGTNVLLIAVVTVVVGYLVSRALVALTGNKRRGVLPAVLVGAFCSVPAAAAGFVALYAIGGAVPIPLSTLAPAMLGWHAAIGVGEAVITGAVVGAVLATRPDLVYLARQHRRPLLLVDADGQARTVTADLPSEGGSNAGAGAGSGSDVGLEPAGGDRPSRSRAVFSVAGLVTLLVAGVVSLLASANPDGLEYVAEHLGFDQLAEDSATAASPLADYAVSGLDAGWATGLAGVIGVLVTATVAVLLTRLARRSGGIGRRGATDHSVEAGDLQPAQVDGRTR